MKKTKKIKDLSLCKTDEERALFFEQHSGFDLLKKGLMEEVTINEIYKKKPKKDQQLNIRIESNLLDDIKMIALKEGLAYQTLVGLWIREKIQENKIHGT